MARVLREKKRRTGERSKVEQTRHNQQRQRNP